MLITMLEFVSSILLCKAESLDPVSYRGTVACTTSFNYLTYLVAKILVSLSPPFDATEPFILKMTAPTLEPVYS